MSCPQEMRTKLLQFRNSESDWVETSVSYVELGRNWLQLGTPTTADVDVVFLVVFFLVKKIWVNLGEILGKMVPG